ncbi:site-specific integrase [Pseudomonas cavernicola]|uniref:Site-specific integrase n=1 Tax=Pseudomonas cavernicola TaxID=2320866 RepID=A0A418XJD9_9PSED|nr:site-specific integrase [Pseudomonas cavernicola]RJG12598.1 site-specific integrase [Pseudomonas cavernicola]
MPAQPAFLTLNRHGTYYFRVVIPKPLRSAFGLQREIRRSLKTDSLRLALRRARQYAARFETAFDKVLGVVDQNDYEPTDEDYELFMEEIEQAGRGEPLGAWSSSPAEPEQKASSALTDEEWQKIDQQQRWSAIAEVLTGNAKRSIPEDRKALADQLFKAGNGIPVPRLRKLLPSLLDELVRQRLGSPGATVAAPAQGTAPSASQPPGPTLYELWLLLRESDKRLNRKKSPSAHTDEQGHARRLTILSGNRPFGSLSLDDINQLYLLTQQVKALPGKNIPPPDSPIESVLASPRDDLISGPTIQKMIIRLRVLHKFAYAKGYTHIDPAKTEAPSVSSETGRIAPKDRPFSKEELHAIFSGYLYTGTDSGSANLVFPYQFWLPLLGLFTGGRLNELCQLETTDIAQEADTEIWFAQLVEEGSKSLKNNHSSRFIPIHNELIKIGFLDFVAQAQREGRKNLFSDGLTYQKIKGWGGIATTFFTRMPSPSTKYGGYFHSIGIRKRLPDGKPDGKKFHAFRHTFIDLLRNTSDEALPLITVLTGHAAKNKNQSDDYGSGFWLSTLHRALHTVKFPIDLSGITYADFEARLGHILKPCIQEHRDRHGLNPSLHPAS